MYKSTKYPSFLLTIIGIIQLPYLLTSVNGCHCFEANDLLQFTQENTDFLVSCRESRLTMSGIGIYKSYTEADFDGDGFPDHDRFGYHLNLDSNRPLCTAGDVNLVITLGDLTDGESCAQLIRERCVDIDHAPLAY